MKLKPFLRLLALFLFLRSTEVRAASFHFTVTSDHQSSNMTGYEYVLGQINSKVGGPGVFHISPGDMVPSDRVWDSLKRVFGNSVVWYPVVGNHETYDYECTGDGDGINCLPWLRQYYKNYLEGMVNPGPVNGEETIYSWDYGNAHFVVLNFHYDGSRDDNGGDRLADQLYDWLLDDLRNNAQDGNHPAIFVFAHEPFFRQPDARNRDLSVKVSLDSVEKEDKFWDLFEQYQVTAFTNGHIHRYSRCQPKPVLSSGDPDYDPICADPPLPLPSQCRDRCLYDADNYPRVGSRYPREEAEVWQICTAYPRHRDYDTFYDTFLNVIVNSSEVIFESWRDTCVEDDGDWRNCSGEFSLFDTWAVSLEDGSIPNDCEHDLNNNGKIEAMDLLIVLQYWSTRTYNDKTWNDSANILMLILQHWGEDTDSC
jgi:calcineurin-like phosphoesterase family protein